MGGFNSSVVITKARKRHVCSWCGETIEKGEIYHRRYCVLEGSGSTIKEHPECAHAENQYYIETSENEWWYFHFVRGCICEGRDSGHGTYPHCQRIKDSRK
jgi:hypothetical protein